MDTTPATSYSCLSQTGTGQLTYNATAHTLVISGVVFIDGSLQFSQTGRKAQDGGSSLFRHKPDP